MPTSANLQSKLHPDRFPDMSKKTGYFLSGILGTNWITNPRWGECGHLFITSTGMVLACDKRLFIGEISGFENDIDRLLSDADLSEEERNEWNTLYANGVTDQRRATYFFGDK